MSASRLALGTAQFGFPYGIANHGAQVSLSEATAIVSVAEQAGMDSLDTAAAYGDSERRLGAIGVQRWHVVSKLPPLPEHCGDVALWVQRTLAQSLERLGIGQLYGLLLHRSGDLRGVDGAALSSALVAVKAQGRVRKVGLSIYHPGELDDIPHGFRPDLVQTPFNVLDRRIVRSGWLARLKSEGIEVHARSVFLQGLLLMAEAARPPHFSPWVDAFRLWENWTRHEGLAPYEAALAFVLAEPGIDRAVVGVDSRTHLEQLVALSGRALQPAVPQSLSQDADDLLNPSRWPV